MNNEQFIQACKNGDIAGANQIKNSFCVSINWKNLFLVVCENGDLKMAKWLYLDVQHINVAFFYIIFERVCGKGHLDIAQWIFSLDPNIMLHCNAAFKLACANGHIHIVKWLHSQGTNLDYDVAYQLAREYSHQNVIDWFSSISNANANANANSNANAKPALLILKSDDAPRIEIVSELPPCTNNSDDDDDIYFNYRFVGDALSKINIPTNNTFPKLTTADIIASLRAVAALPRGYKLKITKGKILEIDSGYTLTRMYRGDNRIRITELLDHTFFELVDNLKNVLKLALNNGNMSVIENYALAISSFLNNYDVFANVYEDNAQIRRRLCDIKNNFNIVYKFLL